MSARLRKWKRIWASFSGAALLAAADSTAFGQVPCEVFPPTHWTPAPQVVPSPYCPQPQPFQPLPQPSPAAPSPAAPSATTPSPTTPEAPAPTDVDLEARAGAGAGESFALTPNMIGDLLLGTSRSVRFGVARVSGAVNYLGQANTSVLNAAVAENESPLPEDRVYFRYNYFNNALSVTGIGPQTQTVPLPAPFTGGTVVQVPATRNYDVNQYTFGAEKTFFDGLMSAEIRVPFRTTLASNNTFSVGNITSFTGDVSPNGPTFNTVTTPQNTLGHEDTEFGDLTLIFKSLLLQRQYFALSAGLATTIPTSPDTDTQVIDYAGTNTIGQASIQRMRDIHIGNDTWAISPFLAGVVTPTDRWYIQGFAEVDFPISSSRITYTDVLTQGHVNGAIILPNGTNLDQAAGNLFEPFAVTSHIREQTLLHLDIGTGYWVVRNPNANWLTGIAPTVELHWTSTLNNAQVVQLPGSAGLDQFNIVNGMVVAKNGAILGADTGPQVGSDRNRVDIVDLTLGTTFEIANRTTVAAAVTLPLRGGDNRTFDYELQLQVNYYFGGPRTRRVPEAPPGF